MQACRRATRETLPRTVINFAAGSHVNRSIARPGDSVQTNVVGPFNLLEAVRGPWEALPSFDRQHWCMRARAGRLLDTGTHDSLLDAASFIATLQQREGFVIGCPEEAAYHQRWIDTAQVDAPAAPLLRSGHGQYLLKLIGK